MTRTPGLARWMAGLLVLSSSSLTVAADAETAAELRRVGSTWQSAARARYSGDRGFARTKTTERFAQAEALGIDDDGMAFSASSVFVPTSGRPIATHYSLNIRFQGDQQGGGSCSVVVGDDGCHLVLTGGRAVVSVRETAVQSWGGARTDGGVRVRIYSRSEGERPRSRWVEDGSIDDDEVDDGSIDDDQVDDGNW